MKCFDCGEEKTGFAFGDRIFLCFECMGKRADKLKEDPNFLKAAKECCCCDSDDVKESRKDGKS